MYKRQEWLLDTDFIWLRTDQCMFELRDFLGDLVMKPTRFVTTAVALATILQVRCDETHNHADIQVRPKGVSASLGTWTMQLGYAIMYGLEQQFQLEHDINNGKTFYGMNFESNEIHSFPAEENMQYGYEAPLQRSTGIIFEDKAPRSFTDWAQVPPLLRAAILKIHKQYSHSISGETLCATSTPWWS